MKIAELPNGKVMQFPEETDDEAIDTAVQRAMADHIAHEEQEAAKSAAEEADKKSRTEREDADRRYTFQRDHEWRQEDIQRTTNHKMREENERKYDRDRKDKFRQEDKAESVASRQEDLAHRQHRDNILSGLQAQLGSIAEAVSALREVNSTITGLAGKVDELGSRIENSILLAVDALTAPKTLVLDARGKPVGVKYAQQPLQLENRGD